MRKRDNEGFTLVELIVVIVILAILIGVTIGGITSYVNRARRNTDINNASSIENTLGSNFLVGQFWNSPKFKHEFKVRNCTLVGNNTTPEINNGGQVYILRWNEDTKKQFETDPSYASFPTSYYKIINNEQDNWYSNRAWSVWRYLSYNQDWEGFPTQNVLQDIPTCQQEGYEFYFIFCFDEKGNTKSFECIPAEQKTV